VICEIYMRYICGMWKQKQEGAGAGVVTSACFITGFRSRAAVGSQTALHPPPPHTHTHNNARCTIRGGGQWPIDDGL
jgi:hypothetical protein